MWKPLCTPLSRQPSKCWGPGVVRPLAGPGRSPGRARGSASPPIGQQFRRLVWVLHRNGRPAVHETISTALPLPLRARAAKRTKVGGRGTQPPSVSDYAPRGAMPVGPSASDERQGAWGSRRRAVRSLRFSAPRVLFPPTPATMPPRQRFLGRRCDAGRPSLIELIKVPITRVPARFRASVARLSNAASIMHRQNRA
jgi:hypothetical protein